MQKWAKIVPIKDIKDGQQYFIGKVVGGGIYTALEFHIRGVNQKLEWGWKPGIAVRYLGSPDFRKYMTENLDYVVVAIPPDADTRWKARQRRSSKRTACIPH